MSTYSRDSILKALASAEEQRRKKCTGGPDLEASMIPSDPEVPARYLASASPYALEEECSTRKNKSCDKAWEIVSWIYRVAWCGPTALLQWMRLMLGLTQLVVQDSDTLPDWIKAIIEPYSFLILSSLIHMLVTVYLVNPPAVTAAVKGLIANYKEPVIGCNQRGTTSMLVLILAFAVFATVAGGFAFYAIIDEVWPLQNDSFTGMVDFMDTLTSTTWLYQTMWWSTNLFTYALSGLALSNMIINLVAYYFRGPSVRLTVYALNRMKEIGNDPSILDAYIRMMKCAYLNQLSDHGANETPPNLLSQFLKSAPIIPEDLYTVALRKDLKDKGTVTSGVSTAAAITLTVFINWGLLSFYFAALRTLPNFVAFIEMAVAFGMTGGLALATVLFIRHLSTINERVFYWPAAIVHGLLQLFWLVYTACGSIGEIFLENSQNLLSLQIVSNTLMLFLFNVAPIFFLYLLIEKGLLKCSSKSTASCMRARSEDSKQKILWMEFKEKCFAILKKSLTNKFISNYLADAFREPSETQSLAFLHLYDGKAMATPSGSLKRSYTVSQTISGLIERYGSHESRAIELQFIGNEGEPHFGQLSELLAPTALRITIDSIRWAFRLAAFLTSICTYESDSTNPMHRLIEWENWSDPRVFMPIILLGLGELIPTIILKTSYVLNKASTYKDMNAVICGQRKNEEVVADRMPENRVMQNLIHCGLLLILFLPAASVLYYILSNILAVTVDAEIENFTADEKQNIAGFFQLGLQILLASGPAAAISSIARASTKCCKSERKERSVSSMFPMQEHTGPTTSINSTTPDQVGA